MDLRTRVDTTLSELIRDFPSISSQQIESIRSDAYTSIDELGLGMEDVMNQVFDQLDSLKSSLPKSHPPLHIDTNCISGSESIPTESCDQSTSLSTSSSVSSPHHKKKLCTMIRSLPNTRMIHIVKSFDRTGNTLSESRPSRHRQLSKIQYKKNPSSSSSSQSSTTEIKTLVPNHQDDTQTIPTIHEPTTSTNKDKDRDKDKDKNEDKDKDEDTVSSISSASDETETEKQETTTVEEGDNDGKPNKDGDEENRMEPDIVLLHIQRTGNYQAYIFSNYKHMEEELMSQSIYEWKNGPMLRNPVYKLSLDEEFWIDSISKYYLGCFNTFILRSLGSRSIGGYDDLASEMHEIFRLEPIHRSLFESRRKIHLEKETTFLPNITEDMNRWFFGSSVPKLVRLSSSSMYLGGMYHGLPEGTGIERTENGYKMGKWKHGQLVYGDIKLNHQQPSSSSS